MASIMRIKAQDLHVGTHLSLEVIKIVEFDAPFVAPMHD
jgi:hypothetical protein